MASYSRQRLLRISFTKTYANYADRREALSDLSFPRARFTTAVAPHKFSSKRVKLVRVVCQGAKLCQAALRSDYVIVSDLLKPG